jgi:hypothetical protein
MDESVLVEWRMEKSDIFDDGGWETKLLRSDVGKDVEEIGRGVGGRGRMNRVDCGRRGDVTRGCGIN